MVECSEGRSSKIFDELNFDIHKSVTGWGSFMSSG